MNKTNDIQLQLQPEVILEVPLHIYEQDFTFIVNEKEFKTSHLIADLLSPAISRQHLNDPTSNTFNIKTNHKGNFSVILDLVNFQKQQISIEDFDFIFEVFEKLGNNSLNIILPDFDDKLTLENIFDLINMHSKSLKFYSKYLRKEIEFLSNHLYELTELQERKLIDLDLDIIDEILSNPALQLRHENQLIKIVNEIYKRNPKSSKLYENVLFSYIDEVNIKEFLQLFDINDISQGIWQNISDRLAHKIEIQIETNKNRYKNVGKIFALKEDNQFEGIINYLNNESKGNIKNLLEINSSSVYSNEYLPYNVCLFDEPMKRFFSDKEENAWISFDFKNHKVIPTHYVIKSMDNGKVGNYLKSWVIEASNNNSDWEKIDEVNNCPYLNGIYLVHTFKINEVLSKDYRFIRLRQTSNNWENKKYLAFGSIEFYGSLI